MTTDEDLIAILRQLCKSRGGQSRFAERYGFERQHISDVFSGRRKITQRMALALGYKRCWEKVKK